MPKKENCSSCEKFKTMIGGQALIEGIMMRGPEKDAVVCHTKDGWNIDVKNRHLVKEGSPLKWPLIRGVYNFFDAQITGVRALMRSADIAAEDEGIEEEPGKFEKWLEEKVGSEKFQSVFVTLAVILGIGLSVVLFFLLPMIIGGLFENWVHSNLGINLVEGIIRMAIFMAYMILLSRMKDMKRLFSFHGAEHKTIRCYEAQLPLTVENVRRQTRLHPRCGTSFLLVVMILSILVFSIASSLLLNIVPEFAAMRGSVFYRVIMILFKLLLLPVVVSISYELNRWVGRTDNMLTRILTAPGMWMQYFTTNEPDDMMIETAIKALEEVLPEKEGSDRW